MNRSTLSAVVFVIILAVIAVMNSPAVVDRANDALDAAVAEIGRKFGGGTQGAPNSDAEAEAVVLAEPGTTEPASAPSGEVGTTQQAAEPDQDSAQQTKQNEGGASQATAQLSEPSFHVLRVEPDGSTVIAGQAGSNANVEVLSGSDTLAATRAAVTGDFVAVLDAPLRPGDYEIVLRSTEENGESAMSSETAIVSVPEKGREDEMLALVEKPGEPSRFITLPDPVASDEDGEQAGSERVAADDAGTSESDDSATGRAATVATEDDEARAVASGNNVQPGDSGDQDEIALANLPDRTGDDGTPAGTAGGESSATPSEGEEAGEEQVALLPSTTDETAADSQPDEVTQPSEDAETGGVSTSTDANDPTVSASAGADRQSGTEFAGNPSPDDARLGNGQTRGRLTDESDTVSSEETPAEQDVQPGANDQLAQAREAPADSVSEPEGGEEPAAADMEIAAVTQEPETDGETDRTAEAPLRIEAVEIDGETVFVAGAARPGANIRVYANEFLLGDTVAGPGGRFLVQVNRDLPPGDYIIRADVIDPATAEVVARAAVPFRRSEQGQQAAVAMADSGPMPEDDATGAGGSAVPDDEPVAEDMMESDAPAQQRQQDAGDEGTEESAGRADVQIAQEQGNATDREPDAVAHESQAAAAEPEEQASTAVPETGDAATGQKVATTEPETGASGGRQGAEDAAESAGSSDVPANETAEPATMAAESGPTEDGGDSALRQPDSIASLQDKQVTVDAPSGSSALAGPPELSADVPVTMGRLRNTDSAVIIRRGDTLWHISRRVYGRGIRYTTIYFANQQQIRDPDMIWPGQIFSLPGEPLPEPSLDEVPG